MYLFNAFAKFYILNVVNFKTLFTVFNQLHSRNKKRNYNELQIYPFTPEMIDSKILEILKI